MNIQKLLIYMSIVSTLSLGAYSLYQNFFNIPQAPLYKAELPQKKSITQTVSASGVLEIKNVMKIGSVVSGLAKDVYAKENQLVKKGELLAEIDPGTGDTDFQSAYLSFIKAQEEFNYRKKNFERQKQLYKANQLAKDAFQKIAKDYTVSELDFKISKATLDKQQLVLNNRKILAIGDGHITAVNVYKGASVSGADVSAAYPPLFEIAPDITEMEAKLDIDESDIGLVQQAQETKLTVNTYPDMAIYTTIKDVGFSPKPTKDGSNGSILYQATLGINNKDKLLRPGMMLNAKINIAKVKDALCVSGFVFQINYKTLEIIAKKLGYTYKPLDKQTRTEFKQTHLKERVKFLWIVENKSFVQRAIVIGVTDENWFEIRSGITEKDLIITDIVEEDEMAKIYKKWFRGPL